MKVLVSGSSGLIGHALIAVLEKNGWSVSRLRRPELWNPQNHTIKTDALKGHEAVIHLAGESIAEGRWSAAKKNRIRQSRVDATQFLANTLSRLPSPPKIFLCASAVGYYGDRPQETLTENSVAGTSFLAKVCRDWENAAEPLTKKGTRVVFLRTGIVLSPQGGALGKMLLPFKMGMGGKIGSGEQYMSWIDIDDWAQAAAYILKNESIKGPVNMTAPNPVSNLEFTKTLGRVLLRPTVFPLPAFAARLVFGEMADELLLASARVEPQKLLKSGYVFKYARLEDSLRHVIRNAGPGLGEPSLPNA